MEPSQNLWNGSC